MARAWRENRPWVLANLAHTAYHDDETIGRLMDAMGAQATEIY